MTESALSILIALLASVAVAGSVLLTLRYLPQITPVYVFAGGTLIGIGVATAIGAYFLNEFEFWTAGSLISLLGVCHLFVFSAVYKSVSLRMLGVLADQPGGRMHVAELVEQVARPSVEERMDVLVDMGLAEKDGDGLFHATAQGIRTDARLARLQHHFGIRSSGLYSNT